MTFRDVVDAHDIALTYGGLHGVINGAGLESAIGRPYNGYYPRVWSKAAALVGSLVRNHPFADGNNRVTADCLRAAPPIANPLPMRHNAWHLQRKEPT